MSLFIIYVIFIVAFFGNLFVDLKIIPPEVTLVTEISVYMLFCISLARRGPKFSLDLVYVYLGFVLVAISSAILNSHLNLNILVGLRPILRFYVFYLALNNLGLKENQYKKINILLFAIFIMQLPASAIRFSYLGISERSIGTYAEHGGGLTPIIPIVAIGYLSGFYIFWKSKLIYILFGIGFVLFGIIGEKRVLFFLYPLAFMGIYYLGYIRGRKVSPIKVVGTAMIFIAAIVAVQLIMMKNIRTLNPEAVYGGGSISYGHVLNYAKEYETSDYYGRPGSGGGRITTTIIGMKTVFDAGIGRIFFGFGPGTVIPSIVTTERRLDRRLLPFINSYGKSGLAYALVEYGLFGLILLSAVFLIFMVRSFKWFKLETEPYWKSLSMGTLVFASLHAFIFFTYNRVPVNDDTIVPVYFYAMSLMNYRIIKIRNE